MRTFRVSFRNVLFLALALLATACGSVTTQGSNNPTTSPSGPLRIAVIPKAIGFDFWEQVHKGAVCAASKQQNVTIIWNGVTAETNVTGQID